MSVVEWDESATGGREGGTLGLTSFVPVTARGFLYIVVMDERSSVRKTEQNRILSSTLMAARWQEKEGRDYLSAEANDAAPGARPPSRHARIHAWFATRARPSTMRLNEHTAIIGDTVVLVPYR